MQYFSELFHSLIHQCTYIGKQIGHEASVTEWLRGEVTVVDFKSPAPRRFRFESHLHSQVLYRVVVLYDAGYIIKAPIQFILSWIIEHAVGFYNGVPNLN